MFLEEDIFAVSAQIPYVFYALDRFQHLEPQRLYFWKIQNIEIQTKAADLQVLFTNIIVVIKSYFTPL